MGHHAGGFGLGPLLYACDFFHSSHNRLFRFIWMQNSFFIRRSSRTGPFLDQVIQVLINQASGFGVVQLLYACDFFLTDNESMNRR